MLSSVSENLSLSVRPAIDWPLAESEMGLAHSNCN